MDNSAMPFQKSQTLHNVRCEATTSSPCINYDFDPSTNLLELIVVSDK
jgi:hypothetical protein